MQDGSHFISKPNKCDGFRPGSSTPEGCPLDHIAPRWAKVSNMCGKMARGWEIEYLLDDLGRTICEVTKRGTA